MRGLIELKLPFSIDQLGRISIGGVIVGKVVDRDKLEQSQQPQPISQPISRPFDKLEVGQQLRTFRGDLVTITDLYRPLNPPQLPQLTNPNHIHPSPTYPIVGQVEGFILETAWTIEGKLKHTTTLPNELDLRLES